MINWIDWYMLNYIHLNIYSFYRHTCTYFLKSKYVNSNRKFSLVQLLHISDSGVCKHFTSWSLLKVYNCQWNCSFVSYVYYRPYNCYIRNSYLSIFSFKVTPHSVVSDESIAIYACWRNNYRLCLARDNRNINTLTACMYVHFMYYNNYACMHTHTELKS